MSIRSIIRAISIALIHSLLLQELAFCAPDLKAISLDLKEEKPLVWARENIGNLPESIATIEDAWKGSSSKTLILIQDAHTNNSGQMNVAKTLDFILKKEPIPYVFLEAGQGNESLSFLRK